MSRCCFSSTFFQPAIWPRKTATLNRGIRLQCGAVDRVGQFAIRSAFLLGAERVMAIDRFTARLAMAAEGGAETINYEETDVYEALMETTVEWGQTHVLMRSVWRPTSRE